MKNMPALLLGRDHGGLAVQMEIQIGRAEDVERLCAEILPNIVRIA